MSEHSECGGYGCPHCRSEAYDEGYAQGRGDQIKEELVYQEKRYAMQLAHPRCSRTGTEFYKHDPSCSDAPLASPPAAEAQMPGDEQCCENAPGRPVVHFGDCKYAARTRGSEETSTPVADGGERHPDDYQSEIEEFEHLEKWAPEDGRDPSKCWLDNAGRCSNPAHQCQPLAPAGERKP